MKLCRTHITQLAKVTVALGFQQTMKYTQLLLSQKNSEKVKKANKLIHHAIQILNTVE